MAIDEAALTGPADFTAEIRDVDGATVVALAGEIDISTAGTLREVLVMLPLDTGPTVRVDLTNVEFLGSSGVGVLVSACRRIKESGGTFSVICNQDDTRRVLEISGLLDYMHVEGAS